MNSARAFCQWDIGKSNIIIIFAAAYRICNLEDESNSA